MRSQQVFQHSQDDSFFNQPTESFFPSNATSKSHSSLPQFHNYLLAQTFLHNNDAHEPMTLSKERLHTPEESHHQHDAIIPSAKNEINSLSSPIQGHRPLENVCFQPSAHYSHINIDTGIDSSVLSGSELSNLQPLNSLTQPSPKTTNKCENELTQLIDYNNGSISTNLQQQTQNKNFEKIRPYGCGAIGCFVSFDSPSKLFYHLKKDHADLTGTPKPFRCAIDSCSKIYKNLNGLQYHVKESKGAYGHNPDNKNTKRFPCGVPDCKRTYRTSSGLRYHQLHGPHTLHEKKKSHLLEHLPVQ